MRCVLERKGIGILGSNRNRHYLGDLVTTFTPTILSLEVVHLVLQLRGSVTFLEAGMDLEAELKERSRVTVNRRFPSSSPELLEEIECGMITYQVK